VVDSTVLPSIAERVDGVDTELFAAIPSQTSVRDRRALLAIQAAVANQHVPFSYLEIGSYLGGSLQVVVADSRCTEVISIDSRPPWAPDDRAGMEGFDYPDNSAGRMLELLRGVPGADLTKLRTIEASTESIPPRECGSPHVCFIDGEHTRAAALRDARFCRSVMGGTGIIVFHDFWIISGAVLDLIRETSGPWRAYLLAGIRGGGVFVVELGVPTLLDDPRVRRELWPRRGWGIANRMNLVPWLLRADLVRQRLRGLR